MAQSTVKEIQGILEVKTDGVWGPKSQKALSDQIGKTGSTGKFNSGANSEAARGERRRLLGAEIAASNCSDHWTCHGLAQRLRVGACEFTDQNMVNGLGSI